MDFDKLIFQSISSKLVEEFEGTIWTVSKKGRSPDPLDRPPPLPLTLDACLNYSLGRLFHLNNNIDKEHFSLSSIIHSLMIDADFSL